MLYFGSIRNSKWVHKVKKASAKHAGKIKIFIMGGGHIKDFQKRWGRDVFLFDVSMNGRQPAQNENLELIQMFSKFFLDELLVQNQLVMVSGMKKSPELNWNFGALVGEEDGRFRIRMETGDKLLKRENIFVWNDQIWEEITQLHDSCQESLTLLIHWLKSIEKEIAVTKLTMRM